MAKVVIAGKADCPYFSRAELLGDKLARNLPDFKLHKIVKQPGDWETWLEDTCAERGWEHGKCPLVWRELIDRGGKGVLIGGANEFQEYANGYYGIASELVSHDMREIAKENLQYKSELDEEEKIWRAQSHPLHVCITNAGSTVSYAMLNAIGRGDVFGQNIEISLHLYDKDETIESLSGMEMEVRDSAHGLVRNVMVTSNIHEAFTDCEAIVLLDEIVQDAEESKEDWLKRNAETYTNYAKILNEVARKNVKVLVAGSGPLNFNVFMMIKNAPNVPRQNFIALSRMVENHAKAIIAEKLSVNSAGVVDLIVWGNINGERYIDINMCRVHGYDGAIWGPPSYSVPAAEMIWDKKWLETEFPPLFEARKGAVQEALGHPAAFSQAASVTSMLEHWWNGSPLGQMFSLAVCSEGWYGVPEGMVFSFPVTMHPKGYWNVVQDIDLTDEMRDKIQACVKDIVSQHEVMFPPPKAPSPPPEDKQPDAYGSSDSGDQTEGSKEGSGKEKKDGESDGEQAEGAEADDKKSLETIDEDKVGETEASKDGPPQEKEGSTDVPDTDTSKDVPYPNPTPTESTD